MLTPHGLAVPSSNQLRRGIAHSVAPPTADGSMTSVASPDRAHSATALGEGREGEKKKKQRERDTGGTGTKHGGLPFSILYRGRSAGRGS